MSHAFINFLTAARTRFLQTTDALNFYKVQMKFNSQAGT